MPDSYQDGPSGAPETTIDAAAEMHRIRTSVRSHSLTAAAQATLATGASIDLSELYRRIRDVRERWSVQELPFESHTPIIGPFIAAFRTAWNSVAAKWHVRRILLQQNEFNYSVYQLLQAVLLQLQKQSEINAALVQEIRKNRDWMLQNEIRNEARQDWEQVQENWSKAKWAEQQETWNHQLYLILSALHPDGGVFLEAGQPTSGESGEDASEAHGGAHYRDFNTAFTGSEPVIKALYRQYVPLFESRKSVLDAGCGQGYFLELMRDAGADSYGVDRDAAMVQVCQLKSLNAVQDDVLHHLAGLPADSLGGIFAGHLIEHLAAESFQRFLSLAYRCLCPRGVLVCETPNTASPFVMANTFHRDLTHQKPVHPETYQFLAQMQGFADTELRYSLPVPPHLTAQPLPTLEVDESYVTHLLIEANDRLDRINHQLFGHQNVALIAYKPSVKSP
jgi:SAM-dependent methyltransferase